MKRLGMNRRSFLKAGAAGLLGANVLAGGTVKAGPSAETREAPKVRKYNTLGKTGLRVSDISLGFAREKMVFRYALDCGINFFDTAESYYQEKHELDVGRAFKDVRDKVIITTKHHFPVPQKVTKKSLMDRFDKSLERLGFDYVDIAMMHQLDDLSVLKNEEILGAYEALKKAGKFRFLGFSTHQAEKICPTAFDSGLFSVMLVIYNSVQYPKRSETIVKANKLGIGVIAMKTMMGREQDKLSELVSERNTYSQAAIKWALSDPNVHNAVLTMRTFEHIEEYLQASGKSLTKEDEKILEKYVRAIDNRYCRIGCTECLASCPEGVSIPDVMRFGMYFENYGQEQRAIMEYAALKEERKARPCSGCKGYCEAACPHRLSVRDRLAKYDGLLRI